MTKWKERGVVEDSDSENESWSFLSNSQETARDGEGRGNKDVAEIAGGHRHHELTIETSHRPQPAGQRPRTQDTALPSSSQELVFTTPNASNDKARHVSYVAVSSPSASIADYTKVPYGLASSPPGPLRLAGEGFSLVPQNDAPLKLRDQERPNHDFEHTTGDLDVIPSSPTVGEALGGLSSGLSSPLSSRSVSPSPPPIHFQLLNQAHVERRQTSQLPEDENRIPTDAHFQFPRFSGHIIASTDAQVAGSDAQAVDSSHNNYVASTFKRRKLRARQEKQLHPYMFDYVQYQRQCKERGMRPVRFADYRPEIPKAHEPPASDHESEFHASFDLTYPSTMLSDPAHDTQSAMQPRKAVDDSPGIFNFGLSSSEDGQESSDEQDIRGSSKRRKLSHYPVDLTSNTIQESHSTIEQNFVPTPPPTSSDSVATNKAEHVPRTFRMPLGMKKSMLKIPQAKANRTPRSSRPLRSPQSSRAKARSTRTLQEQSTMSSSESSEGEGETPNDRQVQETRLRQERRRIKGVLPASWLRLDVQAQKEQPLHDVRELQPSRGDAPARPSPQKGVARVISSRKSEARPLQVTGVSDDESDPDESQARPTGFNSSPTKPASPVHWDMARRAVIVDDDVMELDWVDPMLLESARKKTLSSKSSKYDPTQNRINGWVTRKQKPNRKVNGERGMIPRSKPKSKWKSQSKLKIISGPELSIVDAPRQTERSQESLPQFIRLAVRRARNQPHFGRHSSSQKRIRLATRAETEEATEVLSQWRQGLIAPNKTQPFPSGEHSKSPTAEGHEAEVLTEPLSPKRMALADVTNLPQGRIHVNRRLDQTRPRLQRSKVRRASFQPNPPQKPDATGNLVAQPIDGGLHTGVKEKKTKRKLVRATDQRFRLGQLESLEKDFVNEHRTAGFARRMHCLTETLVRRPGSSRCYYLPLDRYLQENDRESSAQHESDMEPEEPTTAITTEESDVRRPPLTQRRLRKRDSRRIDAETYDYRQPSESFPQDLRQIRRGPASNLAADGALDGLGLPGTVYPTSFDISRLQIGTHFHSNSFIGSGDFAASLTFTSRNLDQAAGRMRIRYENETIEAGAWTEELATQLLRIPRALGELVVATNLEVNLTESYLRSASKEAKFCELLRSTVQYLTKHVSFIDAIDRLSCIRTIHRFIDDLHDQIGSLNSDNSCAQRTLRKCQQYAVVLAAQAYMLTQDPVIPREVQQSSKTVLIHTSHQLIRLQSVRILPDLRRFYEENKHTSKREAGLRDDDTAVSSVVVVRHVLRRLDQSDTSFYGILNQILAGSVDKLNTVFAFEDVWHYVYTLLPVLDIDENGVAKAGGYLPGSENWDLVKNILVRLFKLYPASETRGPSIDDYLRTALTRCFHLTTSWGWWKSESVLGIIFDFFAHRGLKQLHSEQDPGTPDFLKRLNKYPLPQIQLTDCSYHVFLKMLATGLQGMAKYGIYSDKKIGSVAWRFIPNHGRTHRKDDEIRQEDIDALRNHHDLLCTLYYAAPPDHRLQPTLIQNLVNQSVSHRQACRLSVEAWSNLTTFQISVSEPLQRLVPFCDWFCDITTATISQFHFARTEVEQDVAAAAAQGTISVSHDQIQRTITQNQRKIIATLNDALIAFKHVLLIARDLEAAVKLLQGCQFWTVFKLFDPSTRSLNNMLELALEVATAALDIQDKFRVQTETQDASEDSQDFGDASALQEYAATQQCPASLSIVDVLHDPIAQLVSNVFGADTSPDDALLAKVVNIWVRLARHSILDGGRMWLSYINAYTSTAWMQLRDTEQRQKFTPYFFSKILENNDTDFDLDEAGVLDNWIRSLVEREAILKFQQLLTTTLLNRYPEEALIANLPFARDRRTGSYSISLEELRQRRLVLVSTVLSNMRQAYDEAVRDQPRDLRDIRRRYGSMLQGMMQIMKANYLQVQTSDESDLVGERTQGSYIEFVHQVISFLQQYTTTIQPIDEFFTDSSAFPLPAGDPTYVVGKLKSYVPKLAESGTRKQLLSFFQNLTERAAVDREQRYLINQLTKATVGVFEKGDITSPSLRHVLCTCIFPAYVEDSLSFDSSFIAAVPIIEAWAQICEKLLYDAILENKDSVTAAVSSVETLLVSVLFPFRMVLRRQSMLSFPHVLRTLAVTFEALRRCLTPISHLFKWASQTDGLESNIAQVAAFAVQIQAAINPSIQHYPSGIRLMDDVVFPDIPWKDTLQYVRYEVRKTLLNEWQVHDGQYFICKKAFRKEIVFPLGDQDEECERLAQALQQFHKSYTVIFGGRSSYRAHKEEGEMFDIHSIIV